MINNYYYQLRLPIPQVLTTLAVIFTGYSFITFNYVDIHKCPPRLLICSISIAILFIVSFLQLIFKPSYKKISWWKYFYIFTIVSSISVMLSIFNMYFFMALQVNLTLTSYWYIGFATIVITTLSSLISDFLYLKNPTKPKGAIYIILKGIALLFYPIMIVLYLTIPDVYHNKGVLAYVGGVLILMRCLIFVINTVFKLYFESVRNGRKPPMPENKK